MVPDGTLFARAVLGLAGPFTAGTMNPDLVLRLEEALALLPAADSPERAAVLCRLGMEHYWGGERARMESLAREGLEMARRTEDPHTLAAALNVASVLWDSPADTEIRLDVMQEAVDITRAAHDADAEVLARTFLVWAQMEMGDMSGFEETMEANRATAVATRLPRPRWYAALWDATLALWRGEISATEALMIEALSVGHSFDAEGATTAYGAQLVAVRREQGRLAEIESIVQTMVADFPAVPAWRSALALVLAEQGKCDEARTELDVLTRDDCALIPRDNVLLIALALVADSAFLASSPQHADIVYPMLLPFEHRFITVAAIDCWGSVARALGACAATAGRYDVAVAHFERAVCDDERTGGVRNLMRTQWGLAHALLHRDAPGDAARAADLVASTAARCDELEMVSLAGRVRALVEVSA